MDFFTWLRRHEPPDTIRAVLEKLSPNGLPSLTPIRENLAFGPTRTRCTSISVSTGIKGSQFHHALRYFQGFNCS